MPHESSIEIGALDKKSKIIPMLAGPLLGLLLYLILPDAYTNPQGQEVAFTHAARACFGVVVWMAIWWFTEAVPIAVTALIPMVAFPMFGITTPANALKEYANGTVYLFLGGFLIAAGISRWGLDRRIALLTIRMVGTKPQQIIFGVMLSTAFLSAWVSNTATAAMMLPIAMALMNIVRSKSSGEDDSLRQHNFDICVLLSLAYGASVGGMATLIGTPPNGIFMRFAEQTYGVQITFLDWLRISLPITIVMLGVVFLVLTKFRFRKMIGEIEGGREWVNHEIAQLGKLSKGEKVVLAVFATAAVLWFFGPFLRKIEIGGYMPLKQMTDTVIAMTAGIILFVIPIDSKKGIHALDWSGASRAIAWDVLLLFGGGLSMAAAVQSTGAAQAIGSACSGLASLPDLGIATGIGAVTVFSSEVVSNTALAATMMPLVAAVTETIKVDPETMLLVTTFCASCPFMMPVGTPPNAMIFATGKIRIHEMVKTGIWIDIIAILLLPVLCTILRPGMLG